MMLIMKLGNRGPQGNWRCEMGLKKVQYANFGGALDSTWVMKPEVHAELQITRKTDCKLLVANDDNYALAA